MGKKTVWLVVSCLMALSLIMTSCGTAEEEMRRKTKVTITKGDTRVTTSTGGSTTQDQQEQSAAVDSDTPKQGGWLILGSQDFIDFDKISGLLFLFFFRK